MIEHRRNKEIYFEKKEEASNNSINSTDTYSTTQNDSISANNISKKCGSAFLKTATVLVSL